MKRRIKQLLCLSLFLIPLIDGVQADEIIMARVSQSFPEAMLRLQDTLKAQGYNISRVQRVDIGLTKSGYKTDKYRVVFYGRLEEIRKVSQQYPELIPYLPLKIAIFAEGEDTMLVAANPTFLAPKATEELYKILFAWATDLRIVMDKMRQNTEE